MTRNFKSLFSPEQITARLSNKRNRTSSLNSNQVRKKESQYAKKLRELRKLRLLYGDLSPKYLKKVFHKSSSSSAQTYQNVWKTLESRLDIVLYRSGFFESIATARQFIRANKVEINKRKVLSPGAQMLPGDIIQIVDVGMIFNKKMERKGFSSESVSNRWTQGKLSKDVHSWNKQSMAIRLVCSANQSKNEGSLAHLSIDEGSTDGFECKTKLKGKRQDLAQLKKQVGWRFRASPFLLSLWKNSYLEREINLYGLKSLLFTQLFSFLSTFLAVKQYLKQNNNPFFPNEKDYRINKILFSSLKTSLFRSEWIGFLLKPSKKFALSATVLQLLQVIRKDQSVDMAPASSVSRSNIVTNQKHMNLLNDSLTIEGSNLKRVNQYLTISFFSTGADMRGAHLYKPQTKDVNPVKEAYNHPSMSFLLYKPLFFSQNEWFAEQTIDRWFTDTWKIQNILSTGSLQSRRSIARKSSFSKVILSKTELDQISNWIFFTYTLFLKKQFISSFPSKMVAKVKKNSRDAVSVVEQPSLGCSPIDERATVDRSLYSVKKKEQKKATCFRKQKRQPFFKEQPFFESKKSKPLHLEISYIRLCVIFLFPPQRVCLPSFVNLSQIYK